MDIPLSIEGGGGTSMAFLEAQFRALRPAFSRQATFVWFVVVFVGLVLRTDLYGVSSVVRALELSPAYVPSLLHFFHSSAWSVQALYLRWWTWLRAQQILVRVDGRLVMLGDHTKQPKDARRMPQVTTLHQDSRNPDIPSLEIVRFFLSNGVPGNSIAYPELRSGKTGLGLVECIAESSYGLRPVR